jgi:hypothetical protein
MGFPSFLKEQQRTVERSYVQQISIAPIPSRIPGRIINLVKDFKHRISSGWVVYTGHVIVECDSNKRRELHLSPIVISVYVGLDNERSDPDPLFNPRDVPLDLDRVSISS